MKAPWEEVTAILLGADYHLPACEHEQQQCALGLNASLYDLKEIGRRWISSRAQSAHEVLA